MDWCAEREYDNSGVFLRFPGPETKGYQNPACVGVHFGYEVQIDALGAPDGAPIHRTGAIYNEPNQRLSLVPERPAGQWNSFDIQVSGDVC